MWVKLEVIKLPETSQAQKDDIEHYASIRFHNSQSLTNKKEDGDCQGLGEWEKGVFVQWI